MGYRGPLTASVIRMNVPEVEEKSKYDLVLIYLWGLTHSRHQHESDS